MHPLLVLSLVLAVPASLASYDYGEVIRNSQLFYEAQRSGWLPDNNRIPWRSHSATNDGWGDFGRDLTGAWYDAGDHVKFGFPMAYSTTVLAWGIIEYADAYHKAGAYDHALDQIRWTLEYFVRCHISDNEFVGQVGDGYADHAYWGRPEDMTMARPAMKIDAANPGSELAGETAAALAAGYMVFKERDAAFASQLLDHARRLYTFAHTYQKMYHLSITGAADFYKSWNGYNDELVWAGLWLYRATGEQQYLDLANSFNGNSWGSKEFSWDDKYPGTYVLYVMLADNQEARDKLDQFLNYWISEVHYTPKGLAWHMQWGPLRYCANAVFISLLAADQGIRVDECRNFARQQIHYMLGDAGRSYVCGVGHNPPQRPHHRAASCSPDPWVWCDWGDYYKPDPNPNVLYGALVGGPDMWDNYDDDRGDYISNEVATDYNAGFQSALAGMLQL